MIWFSLAQAIKMNFHLLKRHREKCLNRYSKGIGILILLFWVHGISFSQQAYSTTDLLTGQEATKLDSIVEKNRYFLRYGQGKLPFLEEIDLRSETDEWRLSRQEYLFRMSFNSRIGRGFQTLSSWESYSKRYKVNPRGSCWVSLIKLRCGW